MSVPGEKIERRLSARASEIKPAQTLAIAARARQMVRDGIDVISFSTGEPDFDTPEVIADAGVNAIRDGFTHYTDAVGIPELREAIASSFSDRNGIPSAADRVIVSSGGKHAINNVLAAILDPGDEVIFQTPYWVSYPSLVRLNGGTPAPLRTDAADGYKVSPDLLRSAITDRTRCIILNSPSNPTGVMYSEEEIRAFAEIAMEHRCYVLSDELYERIVYGEVEHFSIGSVEGMEDLAITVNGVSKSWAMTGWRIGYATGPIDVIKAAGAIQSQTTSNPCSISQKAALCALTDGDQEAIELREAFRNRRDLMRRGLENVKGITVTEPSGAFYFFVDISELQSHGVGSSLEVSEWLLEEEALALVPGGAFGDDDGLRLSYACSDEDITRGMERFARGIAALTSAPDR